MPFAWVFRHISLTHKFRVLSSLLFQRMPYYAVRRGNQTGVFTSWPECQAQVVGFKGARFKKFDTEEEAQGFVDGIDAAKPPKDGAGDSTSGDSAPKAAKKSAPKRKSDTDVPSDSKRSTPAVVDKIVKSAGLNAAAGDDPVSVYTDGCCHNNGKNGARAGIGVYWGPNDSRNVGSRLSGRPTNNRAEIHAARVAIEQAKEEGIRDLVLHTDSSFLIQSVTSWMPKWKKKNWVLSSGGPVKNREDFEALDETMTDDINVTWVHVAAHTGIDGNEAADKLANEGARKPLEDTE